MQTDRSRLKNAVATYRLQLNKEFNFQDATAIVGYLKNLGISHIYLSPVLESVLGSNHGYDVTDFTRVSAERGGEGALRALDEAARTHGLGMIIDIVPNHMASSLENPFWCDVLKNGRASQYWPLFDFRLGDDDKLHLPILGEALKPGMANLAVENGQLVLSVDGKSLPISTATAEPLRAAANAAGQDLDYYVEHLPAATLQTVLDAQFYRLTPWTEAATRIDYRRFFTIAELVGLRMEDPQVFAVAHAKLFDLLAACPSIEGVRVDHIDGLLDPTAYLHQLEKTAPTIWVEKILAPGEAMRADWPVCGTTGYEFGEKLHQVFVQAGGFVLIEDYWRGQISTAWPDFPTCVFHGKTEVLRNFFAPEMNRLAQLTGGGVDQAKAMWTGVIEGLPVYRTYIVNDAPNSVDQQFIHSAVKTARKYAAWSGADKLPTLLAPHDPGQQQAAREWQQLSGAVMAKGLEDTAHYRYTPLTALNEVGCQPILQDQSPAAFFKWLDQRSAEWPQALSATTTHDTKRNEDVRHRLLALTEIPGDWIALFERLEKMLPTSAIDRSTVYFLLQTIIGSWPFDDQIDDDYRARIKAYLQKAMREAKSRTDWNDPDAAYEDAVIAAIDIFLGKPEALDTVRRFMPPLVRAGALNALTAQVLKVLSPGIPDLYQGTELWNLSLVDPDNRRPVDYARREALTAAFAGQDQRTLVKSFEENWRQGLIKLWLTQRLLQVRREYLLPMGLTPHIRPVIVEGSRADNIIAYTLTASSNAVSGLLIVAPRFTCHLLNPASDGLSLASAGWRDTALNFSRGGKNLFTGENLMVADIVQPALLFRDFPLAVIAF